jgi:four helix bundle protein
MEKNQYSKTFEDLLVWQKSHQFVLAVYKVTSSFSKEELYGLTSQFRRAAISIPANISEGYKKKGKLDKLRFYNISQGSLEECRYYIILSRDLGYITEEVKVTLVRDIVDVSLLLNSYCKAISESI